MANINYSRYSRAELLEALETIDRERFPERHATLLAELNKPERNTNEVFEKEEQEDKVNDKKNKNALLMFFGVLWIGWVLFAYSKGEIHSESVNSVVWITMQDNPKSFIAILTFAFVIGISFILYAFKQDKKLAKT